MNLKSIKLLAICAILVPVFFSCGKSDKQSSNDENGSTEVVEASKSADLNVERIMTYKSINDDSELTSKDYDFLLDQLEIIVDKANELPADEAKNFIRTLDKDQQDAAMVVAIILASSDQSKWNDKQKKRFQELQERDPSNK